MAALGASAGVEHESMSAGMRSECLLQRRAQLGGRRDVIAGTAERLDQPLVMGAGSSTVGAGSGGRVVDVVATVDAAVVEDRPP